MSIERIPLFPLHVVLFPGAAMPLHIFEPRYKLMIRQRLDDRSEFGVVLARDNGVASVGCTAKVVRVVKTYPDGRMDILTAGQRPFVVRSLDESQPLLHADVEFLADDNVGASPDVQSELVALFKKCYSSLVGRAPDTPGVDTDTENPVTRRLAYELAGELPLDLEVRQSLLETRSEAGRQKLLLDHLRAWLPELERLGRLRRKAGGNGHGAV